MFRIAKNLVKTFEQSVSDTIGAGGRLDPYFASVPSNLLVPGNDSNETLNGLRVLSCEVAQLQLQSFFDYIVGIDDQPLPLIQNQHGYLYPDFGAITRTLNAACGSSVGLNVWCGRGGVFRTEYVRVERKQRVEDVPLDSSGDQEYQAFDRLGFSAQWTPLIAATYTYHVLQIHDQASPGSRAGLIPREDYVIGCQEGLLATGGETLLQDILRSRANHDLELYVYNLVSDSVRPVTVHIGGDGRLGCNMGYGYLHRIPAPAGQNNGYTPQQPVDINAQPTLEANYEPAPSGESFIPAGSVGIIPAVSNAVPATTSEFIVPPPVHKRKSKQTNAAAAAASIKDYFQEGKDPSPAPSAKHSPGSSLPPPPPVSVQKDATAGDKAN
ncbi:LAME_0G00958g1_1 [Lachancea meyersii CBS 8951]|uniref:LAME_0G00958g1_1 n=1 Tax=Lachancea meyersii CBS 8951 TaxID=1266667 RepID=A0A1G4K5A6_9SACH|nr:LAME_0G00958g1_1 [Lachancea meyersii CBS 8951]